MQSDTDYKYLKEFNHLKELLHEYFEDDISIDSLWYNNKRMGYPAQINFHLNSKDLKVEIDLESGGMSATLKSHDGSIGMDRFMADEGTFKKDQFILHENKSNEVIIEKFIHTLYNLAKSDSLYFYFWKGDKIYKKKGDEITKVDQDKFFKTT